MINKNSIQQDVVRGSRANRRLRKSLAQQLNESSSQCLQNTFIMPKSMLYQSNDVDPLIKHDYNEMTFSKIRNDSYSCVRPIDNVSKIPNQELTMPNLDGFMNFNVIRDCLANDIG